MELTKAEINQINGLCQVTLTKHWQKNDTMTLLRFAIRDLADTVYMEYAKFAADTNEMLFKYIETENGKPKYKAQIVDIKAKEQPPKQFIWKKKGDEEKYNKELDEYMKLLTDVPVRKYDAKDLLETRINLNDNEIYQLLKYIAL